MHVRVLIASCACLLAARTIEAEQCRDRFLWPFASTSIWNTPIGDKAQYVPANLYPDSTGLHGPPPSFHNDQDFVVHASASDPMTPWLDQGWWGPKNHCSIVSPTPVTHIPLPHDFTSASDGGRSAVWQSNNNAMGLLLPDNRTLVQMQPVYRCSPGAPLLAKFGNSTDGCPQQFPNVTDILGDGALGSHGGSGLSGFGGSIRLGELKEGSPPIRHALKLELYSTAYYYGGKPSLQKPSAYNGGRVQYLWPATGSDSCTATCYKGTNSHVAPGALLAVPPAVAQNVSVTTVVGKRILAALTDYGGYLVDDTGSPTAAICMDANVNSEMRSTYGYSMAYPAGVSPASHEPGAKSLYKDLLTIFRALHAVTNNAPDNIGGGGNRRQPLAPPICGAEEHIAKVPIF